MKIVNGLLKALLVIMVLFSTKTTRAQKILNMPNLERSWWISYNPLNLLEPEVPIAVTVQYKASKWIGIAVDAGVYIAKQDYSDDQYEPYSGFRINPQVKFFVTGERRGPRGFYISLQGIIKNTFDKKLEWLDKTDAAGQFILSQLVNYKEKKFVYGVNIVPGAEFMLGPQKKWLIEIYGGLGVRRKKFKATGLPEGFNINYDKRDDLASRQFNIFQNGSFISAALGFKIGYRISK